jgi:alpha-1,2-mannosyltransferase
LPPAVLLLVCSVLYAVTAARGFVSIDLWTAHFASWRIATTGLPWLDGLHQLPGWLADSPIRGYWVIEDAHDRPVIGRAPGVVAAGLPAYAVLGGSGFSLVPGALTAAFLTALTLTVMYVTWRTQLGARHTLVAVLAFGFATPVWSMAANGMWPHTVTILGIAGMAWALKSERWWLVGAFGGVVLWGRLHAAVIVAFVGLYVAWRRRDPWIAVRTATTSGAALALLCVWSQWMYGSWNPTSAYETTVFVDYATDRLSLANHLGMWVSPGRGILVWTPLILLLLPALARSWRELPDWSKGLLLAGVFYTLLQASLNRFSGGDFVYGYRLTLELLACAFPALVLASLRLGPVARHLVPPVLAVQLVAILVGAVRDGHYLVPSADSWTDNGFLVAMREDPIAIGLLTAYAVLMAVLLSRSRWLAPPTAPPLDAANSRGMTMSGTSSGRSRDVMGEAR